MNHSSPKTVIKNNNKIKCTIMVENMILNLIHQDSHIGNIQLKIRNMKNDVAN